MLTQWKHDYLVDQIHRTAYKKYENYVIGSLIHDKSLSDLKPCTQYYVKRVDGGYALLDLYYPQIELAIEIDEPPHENNVELDETRQRIVEKDLKCEFIRIKISDGNVPNQIRNLKKRITTKCREYRNEDKFQKWLKPRKLDLYKAKKEFKETLFLKIKGEIHPDDLLSRQTGYWVIARDKQKKISRVVVVHDSVISRVFTNIKWHVFAQQPNKVGFTGEDIESDKIVGTFIENWNWQSTVSGKLTTVLLNLP